MTASGQIPGGRAPAPWQSSITALLVYPIFGPAMVSLVLATPLAIVGLFTLGPGGLLYYLFLLVWWLKFLYVLLGPPFLVGGIMAALAGRILGRTSLVAVLAAVACGFIVYLAGVYLLTENIDNLVAGGSDPFSDLIRAPLIVVLVLAATAICWYIARPFGARVSRTLRLTHHAVRGRRMDGWPEGIAALAAAGGLMALVSLVPQNTEAAWADCSGTSSGWDKRISGCTTIIELADEESPERRAIAHLRRGEAVAVVNDDDTAAIGDFTEAIRLDPGNAEAHARRGLAHARLGAHHETIADIDAAFDRSPTPLGEDTPRVYRHRLYQARGEALFATGDIERAILDFGEEIDHAPRYAGGHLNRAAAHLANGDEAGAMADFTGAIAAEEYRADGYVGRGSIYLTRGELDLALADFDEAIRRRPDLRFTAPAYRLRGVVLERRGEEAGARAAYERALELDPGDAAARAGLARLSGAR